MCTKTVTINKGYLVLERIDVMDAFFACDVVLSTKKQFKYTKAEYIRYTNTVKMTRHIWVCPCCGYHMPAYSHFYDGIKLSKVMTRRKAAEWCGDIRSLLDTEDKILDLYSPMYMEDFFCCPECGSVTGHSGETENVVIEQEKGMVKVSCTLNDLSEIIGVSWVPEWEVPEFPLHEVAVFNINKGTTYFEIRTLKGELVVVRDITNVAVEHQRPSKLTSILNKNIYVKSELRKCFNQIWGMEIPFNTEELDLQRLVLLTSYVGYINKDFYYNIPCEFGELTPHSCFKSMRTKLHNSANCTVLMEKSQLPKSKSIKKVLYSFPHLFFFINEIEIMWKLLGEDHNLLLDFLISDYANANLMVLRTNPGVVEFYSDFAQVKTSYELLKLLKFYHEIAFKYAVFYQSFCEKKKADERKRWKKLNRTLRNSYHCLINDELIAKEFITVPLCPTLQELNEQKIDGYVFVRLKTHNQFVKAGMQLNNCLGRVQFENPVFGITKHGRYVAAVELEVESSTVVQAHTKDNDEIDDDKAIYAVYKKWCKRNNISQKYRRRYAF